MKTARTAVAYATPSHAETDGARSGPKSVVSDPDQDNVWVVDASEAADAIDNVEPDAELDAASAYDMSGGDWEPPVTRVRRKLSELKKRIF